MAAIPPSGEPAVSLASAFHALSLLAGVGRPAVFLDYDGTLTPIAERPGAAILPPGARRTIQRLAQVVDVAIVSGRQLDDLVTQVDLDGIAYAGSHGLEVQHADGHRTVHGNAIAYVHDVQSATRSLNRRLLTIEGVFIEQKRFSVAVHYRLVPRVRVQHTCDIVFEIATAFPRLQVLPGKEVLELRPRTAWNKGAAVALLVTELATIPTMPVFIGDDFTDEDAFCAIGPRGIGIAIGGMRPTAARFGLADTTDVLTWLDALAVLLEHGAFELESSH